MSAKELPGVLARAFALFQAGRPRPVHIEIPLDVLVENADDLLDSEPVSITRAGPAPAAIKQMSTLLANAKRPLILAGGGAIDAAAALTQLAERLDAPVALTINAKGMLPSHHPLLIGSTQSLDPTRELIEAADVVLAIGTELAETDYDITFQGHFKIPGTLLRIDIDPDQTVRSFPPKVALVSDSQTAAEALVESLAHEHLAPRNEDWGHTRAAALRATLDASWDEAAREQTLFLKTVLEVLPNIVLVGDSTQPVYTGNLTLDLDQPRRWFNSSTGYGTLGYALPAAVGAWLGSQDKGERNPVACLIGDGGLQFTLSELASAVEARTPIIVLLWNNQGYEEIKKYMVNRDIEPVGVDIYTPDFIGVAKALGCAAEAISSVEQLKAALNAANDRQGPTVIEIDQRNWMNGLNPS
jgi:acetolactate synthase-1/2/3 large subunit